MASIMEKLLADAKQLTLRLKERDEMAEKLISSTLSVQNKLDSMKQYQGVVDELNELARHRPRMFLIQQLSKENAKIKNLQQDNNELKQSLEEHQSTLGVIMNKYREQIENLNSTQQLEESFVNKNDDYSEDLKEKEEKIKEMASVMFIASENWETNTKDKKEEQKLMNLLHEKNKIMREVLFNIPQSVPSNEKCNKKNAGDNTFVTPKQSSRTTPEVPKFSEAQKRISLLPLNHYNSLGSDNNEIDSQVWSS